NFHVERFAAFLLAGVTNDGAKRLRSHLDGRTRKSYFSAVARLQAELGSLLQSPRIGWNAVANPQREQRFFSETEVRGRSLDLDRGRAAPPGTHAPATASTATSTRI